MKGKFKIFLFLGGLILFFGGLTFWQSGLPTKKYEEEKPLPSSFEKAIEEAKKKEEVKKAEEEKKRQEEETRQFIATYGPCRSVPILMYHHVADNPPAGGGSLYVRTDYFREQMAYLGAKGYASVTLPEVVESFAGGRPLAPKPVVLTFDDGYRDFYQNAYSILKSYNLAATVFVISQYVGGEAYVSWGELGEMTGSGLISVGDHTLSHLSLPTLSKERLRDEIISARNIIEQNLGIRVNLFAYPYGGGSVEAEKILKEAGFVAAVTSQRGLACAKLPFDLPRIRIGNALLGSYGL